MITMADQITVNVEWGDWKKFYKKASNIAQDWNVIFNTVALQSENRMKQKAPWQNRTGLARKTLRGTAALSGSELQLTLSHGMWYGIYLELAHQKRFAIIKPTMDSYTKPEVEKQIKQYYDALTKI